MEIVECKMPDLTTLHKKKAISRFLVCQLVGAGVNFPQTMSSYRANFVRLADKAIIEYCEAREYALAEIEEPKRSVRDMEKNGRYIYVHFIANSLENCIVTTRRLFNYFDKIRHDKTRFVVDKNFKKSLLVFEKSIIDIRGAIIHLDKDILREELKSGEPVMPILNSDCTKISIGKFTLSTLSLADTLEKFHYFAIEFSGYQVDDKGNYKKL